MAVVVSWLMALLNFPGIIMHEFSHKFFCDWAGVRVLKVCYFRMGNPAGFVIHESAKKFSQSFFIAIGPFIIGVVASSLLFLLSGQHTGTLAGFVYVWLGLTIAANAFPSTGDAKALWSDARKYFWRNPLASIGFFAVLIIWVVNKLNIFYFNYIFSLVLYWLVLSYV